MPMRKVVVDRSLVAVPRHRTRRRYRKVARDVGTGILYTAGAGAVVALLASLDDIRNSKEARDHWWLLPVGLIAIGYMLRKRRNPHANAVIAVGGAMFALSYMAQQKAAQAGQAGQGQSGDTAGPAGYFGPTQTGFWVQTPDGRLVRLPHITRRVAGSRMHNREAMRS